MAMSPVACDSTTTEKTNEAASAVTDVPKLTGTVSTDGSTSMEKVIGGLGEMFMEMNEGVTFTYNPTGSGTGIKAVAEGRCDIGLSSRFLKDEERAQGLVESVLAYDGIAVIVNPENVVADLTIQQIAAIFTGEVANWSDLDGDDSEIVLIGREAGSGTRRGFEEIVSVEDKCLYRQELTSIGDVITSVSQNLGAIGYASLISVKNTVKAVNVGGVVPCEETVKNETYAIQRPFVLVTMEGAELTAAAQAFFDYAMSTEANEVIASAGVVPASN